MREPMRNGERQIDMSTRRWSRSLPLLAVAALTLAACGEGDSIVSPAPDGGDGDAALRAPTPIEIVGGASSPNAGGVASATAESDDAAAETSMIAPVGHIEYVVADGLAGLPSDDTGYVFEPDVDPTTGQIEAIAAALGVDGDVVASNDGYQDSWRIGPDDGSAASIWVYGDAVLPWSYNGPWADDEAYACAVAGSPGEPVEVDALEGSTTDSSSDEPRNDDEMVDEPEPVDEAEFVEPECEEPPAPENVPTADEAEALAADLLAALGVVTNGLEFETFADDWFASVTAWNPNSPLGQAQQWNFGFGGDAALDYASGNLADPAPVGPYPLIDLGAAIERLNAGDRWFGAMGGPVIASGGVAEPAIVMTDDVAIDSEMAEEPLAIEPDMEPQDITITLVDVEADLWWAWDVDGAAWLLPAYRFVDSAGGWHVVPAVTDEFLVEVDGGAEPLPEPEPLPPAPAPVDDTLMLTEAGLGVDDPGLREFIGLPVADFEQAVAEELGLGPFRIVAEDGEWLGATDDLVAGRVNMAVVDGVVTGAVIEADLGVVDAPDAAAFPAELEWMMGRSVDDFIDAAESFALTVRVVEIDGNPLDREDDFNPSRINVALFTLEDRTQIVIRAEDDAGLTLSEIDPNEVNDLIEGQTPVDPSAVGIAAVHEGVEFYPACGDERLIHDGITWYQVQSFDYPDVYEGIVGIPRDGIEDDLLRTTGEPTGFGGLRVVDPGPGDDIGTLVIWMDGTARWTSDSGNLSTWLVQDELVYEWTC